MNIHTRQRGFTLVELLVVIAIIGILAAALLGSNLLTSRARAGNAKKIADVKKVQQGLEQYYAIEQAYPDDEGCAEAFLNGDYFSSPIKKDAFTYVNCTPTSYCVCNQLTKIGGEYQGGNAQSGCSYADDEEMDHYCVEHLQ